MAFCPHCGKPAGEQATKCLACGKEIARAAVGGRGGFKGTMMMATPAVAAPKGATAASAIEPESAPMAKPQAAAKPAPVAPPPPAAEAPDPATDNRPSALKATMVGGMGVAAPMPRPAPAPPPAAVRGPERPAPVAVAPPEPTQQDMPHPDGPAAFAKTAPLPASAPIGVVQPNPAAPSAPVEDSAALLAGDPMASTGGAPAPPPERQRPPRPASFDYTPAPTGPSNWTWVVAGFIGMIVIAGCGLLAAKLMGLL